MYLTSSSLTSEVYFTYMCETAMQEVAAPAQFRLIDGWKKSDMECNDSTRSEVKRKVHPNAESYHGLRSSHGSAC